MKLTSQSLKTLFPAAGHAPPKVRAREVRKPPRLPEGTVVFSADNHISLAEDIFYQRFPNSMKDRAPRVWYERDIFQLGDSRGSYLPPSYTDPLAHFDVIPGCSSLRMDERMADLDAEGIDKELVFSNGVLAMLGHPDFEVRDLCYRIYNEYLAELQSRAPGRFYGVGLMNWWDAKGTRRCLDELKKLGLKTYLLPTNPLKDPEGRTIDWASDRQTPVWEEIADAGIPVAHHIGESPKDCAFNAMTVSFLYNVHTFRDMFGRYVFGGILDRHPQLKVGWYEGGVNWVISTLQDADYANAAYRQLHDLQINHEPEWYWRNHMASAFIIDPLGLEMIDRIGADRVMWSSDYPHVESSYGYSGSSIQCVLDMVDPKTVPAVLGGNAMRFLGI
jgi:predicted TIM-barrel fold metal-dependent hydrolase